MEQGNFKRFKCEDEKEYIFDFNAFKMELRRTALCAKKAGQVNTIEEFEEMLADEIAVSTAAIKQWKAGRNGVSDIERVKEIANFLGLTNYKQLLIEQIEKEEMEDMTMQHCIYEDERKVAREVFNGFVEVIKAYRDTEAYANCEGAYGIPTSEEILELNDAVELIVQKARFDIPKEIHTQLTQLFFEICSTYPKEIQAEGNLSRHLIVERKADTYFEELCNVLSKYIK